MNFIDHVCFFCCQGRAAMSGSTPSNGEKSSQLFSWWRSWSFCTGTGFYYWAQQQYALRPDSHCVSGTHTLSVTMSADLEVRDWAQCCSPIQRPILQPFYFVFFVYLMYTLRNFLKRGNKSKAMILSVSMNQSSFYFFMLQSLKNSKRHKLIHLF